MKEDVKLTFSVAGTVAALGSIAAAGQARAMNRLRLLGLPADVDNETLAKRLGHHEMVPELVVQFMGLCHRDEKLNLSSARRNPLLPCLTG